MKIFITFIAIITFSNIFAQVIDPYFSHPDRKDEKWGLVDTNHNILLPYEYDNIFAWGFYNNKPFYKIQKNYRWGLVNEQGKEILPCKHADIDFLNNGKQDIIVFKDIFDLQGYYVFYTDYKSECTYTYIGTAYHSGKVFILLKKLDKSGLADTTGEIMLDAIYEDIGMVETPEYSLNGDRVIKVTKELFPGTDYYNISEEEIYKYFADGLYDLDKKNWIIPIVDNHITLLDDLIIISKDKKLAVYEQGKTPDYRFSFFEEKDAAVSDNQTVFYYIFDDQYLCFRRNFLGPYNKFDFSDSKYGFVSVEKSGKWGLLSLNTGKESTPFIYDSPPEIKEDLFAPYYMKIVTGKIDGNIFMTDTLGKILYKTSEGKIAEKDGKYGFTYVVPGTSTEINTVPCEYDKIELFEADYMESDLLLVTKNNSIGLINTRNQILIPVEQKEIVRYYDDPEDRFVIRYSNGKTSWIYFPETDNSIGPDIISYEYMETGEELMCISSKNKSKKYQIWSHDGEEVCPDLFDDIMMSFSEDMNGKMFLYSVKNGKYGILNSKGEKTVDNKYDDLSEMLEEPSDDNIIILRSKISGKFGLVEVDGKEIVPNIYDAVEYCDIDRYDGYYYVVKLNGKYGLIDYNNVIRIPVEYDYFENVYSWMQISKNKLYGYLDDSLRLTIKCKYEEADDLGDNYAIVKYNGKKGVINREDRFLIKAAYQDINNCDTPYFKVMDKSLWGIMDTTGKWIIEPQFSFIDEIWKNSTCAVKKEKKCALVNYKTGERMCDFIYNEISYLSMSDYAVVKRNNKAGYLDQNGKEVIPCEYENLTMFAYNNLVTARKNGKYGFIDVANTVKIDFQYDDALPFNVGYARVCKSKKWGIIDTTGKAISPFEYDKITFNDEKYAIAVKGGKYGVIRPNGEIVHPFEYSVIENNGSNFRYEKGKKESGHWEK